MQTNQGVKIERSGYITLDNVSILYTFLSDEIIHTGVIVVTKSKQINHVTGDISVQPSLCL